MQQITQSHLAELLTLLDSGDRGGFYLRYYELSGSRQALIQAHITTYSGFFGGAAILGNAIAKFSNPTEYDIALDVFSHDIAVALLNGISADVDDGKSGLLTDAQIQDLDHGVWIDKEMGDYFPGNIQMWSQSLDLLFSAGTLSAVLAGLQLTFGSEVGFEAEDYPSGYVDNTSIPGVTVIREGGPTGKVLHVEEHLGIVEDETGGLSDEPAFALAAALMPVLGLGGLASTAIAAPLIAGFVNEAVGDATGTFGSLLVSSLFSDALTDAGLRSQFTNFLGAAGNDVDPNGSFPLDTIFTDFPIVMNNQGTLNDTVGAHILIGHGTSSTNGQDGGDMLIGFNQATMSGGEGSDLLLGKSDAFLNGDAGGDILFGMNDATLDGGAGRDWLLAIDNAVAQGGAGSDVLLAYGEATVDGGEGDDWLFFYSNTFVAPATGLPPNLRA